MRTLVEDYDIVVVGAVMPDVKQHLRRAPGPEYSDVYCKCRQYRINAM